MSDLPTPLTFVDPAATDPTYRVCLWNAQGEGKSVAATSAPGPLLVVNADRPSAYLFARKHHAGKDIREVRYEGPQTLTQVYEYLSAPGCDIKTVVIDPVGNIVDQLADVAPAGREGGPDYSWINKQVFRFVKGLRRFDIHVVLVAHEKLNDGKRGDGKMYPALGGAALINKLLGEMDIVARVSRVIREVDDEEQVSYVGQLQPTANYVCKQSTAADLGDRRIADLTRWFELANDALAPNDDSDVPFGTQQPAPNAHPDEPVVVTVDDLVAQGKLETEAA